MATLGNNMRFKDWGKLFNTDRFGKSPQLPNHYRTEFEEDYDNIAFSTAFRRLQGKTQVFGLSGSDYVRTRLTHSFEVSSVGRSLGTMVENRCSGKMPNQPSNLGTIVAAACLAHDIGNAPFGHSGEAAIQQWYKDSQIAKSLRLSESQAADLANYEGNAQGFRILTRLQGQGCGLKITYSTLAAMTKYPNCSGSAPKPSKFGYFESEKDYFAKVARETGLLPWAGDSNRWCRHPAAYLVEAADDLCNRIVDFEDAARLQILSRTKVLSEFNKLRRLLDIEQPRSDLRQQAKIEFLSRKLLPKLTILTAKAFLEHEQSILAGRLNGEPLIKTLEGSIAKRLDVIGRILHTKVFSSRQVVEVEAPAFRVLDTLLESFVGANEEFWNCKRRSKRSQVVMALLPLEFHSHLKQSARPKLTPYERLLDILDFVSGMTDSYAVGLYKTLTGISLPCV